MKKLIAMLLALAMCFTLVACDGNTPPPPMAMRTARAAPRLPV